MDRNTMIEDAPQVSVRRLPPQKLQPRPSVISPRSDNFPTPTANVFAASRLTARPSSPADSDTPSERSPVWSKRSSTSRFDEMYDVTSSESEGEVPIKLSTSVRKKWAPKSKYPSLVIPSPSLWPTIEKLKSAVTPISPPLKIALDRSILAQLNSCEPSNLSAPPSLDGNSTDDDLQSSTCPSTPDIAQQVDDEGTWDVPIQLDPSSISLLHHISGEYDQEPLDTVIEVPEEAAREMREIVESPRSPLRMRLDTQNLAPASAVDAEEQLSNLSVPSPSVFFSSLSSSDARRTWSARQEVPPTSVATEFYDVPFRPARTAALPTSTATRFYNLPWEERPENPVQHTVLVDSPLASPNQPVTAIRVAASPVVRSEEVDEIDERYDDAIKETAAANMGRTMLWLNAQTDYMKAVCEEDDMAESFKDIADAVPSTPEQKMSETFEEVSPSKKTVRWADEKPLTLELPKPEPKPKRISPIHDGTFWEGWRHTKRSARARDVFQQRQARAEAEHVIRTSCSKQHIEQLQGKFEIISIDRPAPSRPISNLIPVSTAEDEQKDIIDKAERERKALEQMQSSSWHLSAQRELSGGKLLTSPVVESFKGRKDVRILDVGGQVHCSWAWNVALEHPDGMVYTTVSSDAEAHVAESTLDGPANHCVVAAPNAWQMPFEDNHFDVISARNLHAHLKAMWPKGQAADEWDLTLRECMRCLKPGGYLEFNLLDAELVHPEPAGQALGVEFAFNLKTRGYDPSSGRIFLPRLKRAGFQSIKRAWLVLPVADVLPRWTDLGKSAEIEGAVEKIIGPNGEITNYTAPVTGSTKDVRAVTGMVGARMWEQWMLKLNGEMGRSETRCLEGVAKALEECGKGNAGWRCLVGWAKKDE